MKWTETQELALEKMRSGTNVFLTGEAGTGKSEVIKAYIQELRDCEKNILITAPTGIAADNLGGETLHRVFEADIGVISNRKRPKSRNNLMKATDVIIIDEISMCRIDLFEYVAQIIITENEYRQQERFKADMGVEPPKQQDIEEVFKGIDKDNDGAIDYSEFALLIKNILLSLIKNEEGDENENDIDI